jgi:hypothetical protein
MLPIPPIEPVECDAGIVAIHTVYVDLDEIEYSRVVGEDGIERTVVTDLGPSAVIVRDGHPNAAAIDRTWREAQLQKLLDQQNEIEE